MMSNVDFGRGETGACVSVCKAKDGCSPSSARKMKRRPIKKGKDEKRRLKTGLES